MRKMKLLLLAMLLALVLCACGSNDDDDENDPEGVTPTESVAEATPTAEATPGTDVTPTEEPTPSAEPTAEPTPTEEVLNPDDDNDGDGAPNGWEQEHGYDPNARDERFADLEVTWDAEEIKAKAILMADWFTYANTRIEAMDPTEDINDTIPGYLGPAFRFYSIAPAEIGLVTLTFDIGEKAGESGMLGASGLPTIYGLNEETMRWYEFETAVDGTTLSARVTEFGIFIVLDKTVYDREMARGREVDLSKAPADDANRDGISDYVTKLLCDGTIRTTTGALAFGKHTYEEVQANNDIDGNGFLNGEELEIMTNLKARDGAVEFQGRYYQVFDQGFLWDDVKSFCESWGGHLVTVTSEEEQKFVEELLKDGKKKCYWLGATDVREEGTFEWVTGEPWEYTNWDPFEPNNDGAEDYCEIMTWREYRWNDGERDGDANAANFSKDDHGFICEWESGEIASGAYVRRRKLPMLTDISKERFEQTGKARRAQVEQNVKVSYNGESILRNTVIAKSDLDGKIFLHEAYFYDRTPGFGDSEEQFFYILYYTHVEYEDPVVKSCPVYTDGSNLILAEHAWGGMFHGEGMSSLQVYLIRDDKAGADGFFDRTTYHAEFYDLESEEMWNETVAPREIEPNRGGTFCETMKAGPEDVPNADEYKSIRLSGYSIDDIGKSSANGTLEVGTKIPRSTGESATLESDFKAWLTENLSIDDPDNSVAVMLMVFDEENKKVCDGVVSLGFTHMMFTGTVTETGLVIDKLEECSDATNGILAIKMKAEEYEQGGSSAQGNE